MVLASWAPAMAQDPSAGAPASPAPVASSSPVAPAVEAQPAGTWLVTAYDAWGDGLAAPLPGSTLTVSLLSEGRLEGETGCGTYVGGYTVDGEGIRLGVISKGSDPCGGRRTDEAFDFTQALALATTWAASPAGLELSDGAGLIRVVLERASSAGLVGDWTVLRYARPGGDLGAVVEGTEVTISFGEDGQVRGSTGCRTFGGRYTMEVDRVVIAPIVIVGLPCEGDARRLDRRIRALLDAAVLWQRSGATLTLSDGAGSVLVEASPRAAPTPSVEPTSSVGPMPSLNPSAAAE
jgi:heat shock protein HslJ